MKRLENMAGPDGTPDFFIPAAQGRRMLAVEA